MVGVGKIVLYFVIGLMFIPSVPRAIGCGDYGDPCGSPPGYTWSCPAEHPYYNRALGGCYDQPQGGGGGGGCTGDYPYLHSDGKCWNVPEGCGGDYPYLHSDGKCWNVPEGGGGGGGCTGDYPYLHSDGKCWNIPECPPGYYYATDGRCYPK